MRDTICLIHGMSVSSWCWDNYIPLLREKGYDCMAPALPYHNVSPHAAPDPRLGTVSLLDYASYLEGEIRKLPSKPILVGHSMGGLLAQILASRGLARAMVLLMPAAPAGVVSMKWSVLRSFGSILTTRRFWQKPVRQTRREFEYGVLNRCVAEECRRVSERLVFESGSAVFEMGFWFLDKRSASRVDEANVTCPTLVVAAGADRMTPRALVERVAAKYRSVSTYRVFAEHGHWAVGEPGWQDIADAVLTWLEEHAPPRSRVVPSSAL